MWFGLFRAEHVPEHLGQAFELRRFENRLHFDKYSIDCNFHGKIPNCLRCPAVAVCWAFPSDRMQHMENKRGKIIIPAGVNVWPHELDTAKALAAAGYVVEFAERREGQHEKSADLIIAGQLWEMKAPNGSSMKAVERNLRKACAQSLNVVFDSARLKSIPDKAIERELRTCASGRVKQLKHLLFVNKRHKVIEIK